VKRSINKNWVRDRIMEEAIEKIIDNVGKESNGNKSEDNCNTCSQDPSTMTQDRSNRLTRALRFRLFSGSGK
jgi:hypothetical protein